MHPPDKFLWSRNPISQPDETQHYIFHTQQPRFLALIQAFDTQEIFSKEETEGGHTLTFNTEFTESNVKTYSFQIVQNIDNASREELNIELKLASEWYEQFLMILKDYERDYLKDYDENTPGLKVMMHESSQSWTVHYKGKYKLFTDTEELDDYLNSLDIADKLPFSGIINYVV